MALAHEGLAQLREQRASLDRLPLPVHLDVAALAQPGLPPDLGEALLALLRPIYPLSERFAAWVREKLSTKQCWLVLDALDWVDARDRLRVLETPAWQCHVVLICRRGSYDRVQVPWTTLTEYVVAPLQEQEIWQFSAHVTQKTQRSDLYANGLRSLARQEHWHTNLPPLTNIFIGRVTELVQISNWMEEHRCPVIALTGLGGIGKSSLALAAARWNSWRFHRVIYLSAKATAGPKALTLDAICREVDAVLQLGEEFRNLPSEARPARAAAVLNARPYLLILDNLEVLTVEQAAELTDFLQCLDPGSGTVALLTLRPEHFPPLVDRRLHDLYHLAVPSLAPPDAVALLSELLKRPGARESPAAEGLGWNKVPSRPVTPRAYARLELLAQQGDAPLDKVAALQELAATAHYHPMLLRFAAADLQEPGSDWGDVLHRLRGLRGEDVQQQVAAMIGAMCNDLAQRKPEALTLLQALLTFSGGATREALQCVWGGEHGGSGRLATISGAIRRVLAFVGRGQRVGPDRSEEAKFDAAYAAAHRASLLDVPGQRYDLPPLVRQYLGGHHPPDAQQRQQWVRAHAAYFLNYARWLWNDYDALERERLNVFTALEGAEQGGETRSVVEFACVLFDFLWVRGWWSEGREWMTRGVAAARRLRDRRAEAVLLHQLGILCAEQGDAAEARRCYEDSLALEKQLGDTGGTARTLHQLGILSRQQGEWAAARGYYEQSLALKEALGDKGGIARTLHQLGVLCSAQGEWAAARGYYEQSLALREELGDKGGTAATLHDLAVLERHAGQVDSAEGFHHRGLELAKEIGSLYWQAWLEPAGGGGRARRGDLHGIPSPLRSQVPAPLEQGGPGEP
jgi:tetratricopeptide (TPR) repeat protein